MSRTPSWVLLGFILGTLFMGLLPQREPEKVQPPKPEAQAQPKAAKEAAPRRLSDIEAVFSEWGKYAIWDQDRTEVALWNSQTNSFSDAYEVLREGEMLYFRSIPALTRPLLAHATHSESPLVFTETVEMRRKWLEARRELVPARPASPEGK